MNIFGANFNWLWRIYLLTYLGHQSSLPIEEAFSEARRRYFAYIYFLFFVFNNADIEFEGYYLIFIRCVTWRSYNLGNFLDFLLPFIQRIFKGYSRSFFTCILKEYYCCCKKKFLEFDKYWIWRRGTRGMWGGNTCSW